MRAMQSGALMGIQFKYEPPKVDAGLKMHASIAVAETAAAEALLALSQPRVPVESGDLQASGHVEHDGHGAAVIYSATNAQDGYNYAAKQHEDESLHHPNGGGAHYLSDPMQTDGPALLAAAAAKLRF